MFFKQYYLGCLAHASYLIGDQSSGVAAVVDPQRDIDQYVADAGANGLAIKYVLLTHFHADFLSGHLELRQATGAQIVMGDKAKAEFALTNLNCGDTLELGQQVTIKLLETPGHTPESSCFLVFDNEKSKTVPYGVLTGDTLFVGDVGRPDLLVSAGVTAEELAGQLYDSLHLKLMTLPDEVLVYPAHGAGSMCGKNLGKETYSTIGHQKQFNYALKIKDKDEFINSVASDQPEAPGYFGHDAVLNKRERPTLSENLEQKLQPMTLEQVLAESGAQILDVRSPSEFAKGFLKGSISIGLQGTYATWAGTVLELHQPIILVAPQGKEMEAAVRLGRIGFDHIVGYLDGGAATFLSRSDLVESFQRWTVQDLEKFRATSPKPVVLDVRNIGEWTGKHIEGTVCIPLGQLKKRLSEVPSGDPLVIHCAGGYRSMIAASILRRNGVTNLTDVIGGFNAWVEAGLPTVSENAASCGATTCSA